MMLMAASPAGVRSVISAQGRPASASASASGAAAALSSSTTTGMTRMAASWPNTSSVAGGPGVMAVILPRRYRLQPRSAQRETVADSPLASPMMLPGSGTLGAGRVLQQRDELLRPG